MEGAFRKRRFQVNCNTHRLAVIAFGLAILLLLGVVFSFLLGYLMAIHQLTDQPDYVYYYPRWEYQLDRSDPHEAEILESREFQIDIPTDVYTDREAAVEDLLEFLRDWTGLKLKKKDAETDIYSETHYYTLSCGHRFSELRSRDFFTLDDGDLIEGESTVDINNDADPPTFKADAMRWNFTAAPQYKTEEKLEQDIHKHSHKFNRKNKVKNLPSGTGFKWCGNVTEMFPNAFDAAGIKNVDKDVLVPHNTARYIWQHSYKDDLFHGILKTKFSWTLYYFALEDALNSTAVPDSHSEFSFRVYSPGEGYGPWQYEALVYAADLYKALLRYY